MRSCPCVCKSPDCRADQLSAEANAYTDSEPDWDSNIPRITHKAREEQYWKFWTDEYFACLARAGIPWELVSKPEK